MKICLATRYFDVRNAGLARVGSEIRDGLINNGHEVLPVSTNGESLYSYFYYTAIGIKTKLPKNVDVYHAITPMEARWLPKNKSVVTFHDIFQLTDPTKLGSGIGYSKWKNFIGRKYFNYTLQSAIQCKKIVAVSNKTRDELIKYLNIPKERIRVIRSGISPDLDIKPVTDLPFTIGYLGQLDRRKRVDLLIEAFKSSNLPQLYIGGTGADASLLFTQARYDNRIKFFGYVPEDYMSTFYNALDVFVFPTWAEGYGLPIVEAMACGKPVIVLRDAKIPEEIKSRCIVVDDLSILSSKKLFSLIENVNITDNYIWAKTHSWEKTVEAYVEVYNEIITGT